MFRLWRAVLAAVCYVLMLEGDTFSACTESKVVARISSHSFLQPQLSSSIVSGTQFAVANCSSRICKHDLGSTGQQSTAKKVVASTACFANEPRTCILRAQADPSTVGFTDEAEKESNSDLLFRIGHGYDLHRLSDNPRVRTGNLVLAGIPFTEELRSGSQNTRAPGLLPTLRNTFRSLWRLRNSTDGERNITLGVVAHSDGDVVMHATADAIFGALGCEDIGQHFPDSSERNKGRRSKDFVEAAVNAAASRGYFLANIDVTILLEKPKICLKKSLMIRALASALRAQPDQVNLKAKTGEGCGPVGTGQAVECHVVALLQKGGNSRVGK